MNLILILKLKLKLNMSQHSDKNQTKETTITSDIIIIWDESGSMKMMGCEPVDAVNTFIDGQKNGKEDKSNITFVKFSTDIKVVLDDVPLKSVKKIKYTEYNPKGLTSLFDAICMTFKKKLKSKNNRNVVVLIMTDGEDTSSIRYKKDDVKKMIKKLETTYNWKIIFLGSNIDTAFESQGLNIKNYLSFSQQTPGNLTQICRCTSANISDYRKNLSSNKRVKFELSPVFSNSNQSGFLDKPSL